MNQMFTTMHMLIYNLSYGIAAAYLLLFIIALFGRKLIGV
jgi:hypothetical protein